MKVGILGSGAVGSRLASLFQASGHDVVVGSRSSERTSHQDAIAHGDVVVLAMPFVVLKDMLPPLASALAGKIVVDATNPLKDDWSPVELSGTSGAEEVAKLLPESTIVKAFNTIFADVMKADVITAHDDISAFVASDDDAAVEVVAKLALECGFCQSRFPSFLLPVIWKPWHISTLNWPLERMGVAPMRSSLSNALTSLTLFAD